MQVTTSISKDPTTTILYPKSRLYPFDEVCEKIVRMLEERNWNAPGIEIKFEDCEDGSTIYRKVVRITGNQFQLRFKRDHEAIYPWSELCADRAAISTIIIPKKELRVFGDQSGPLYYTYVGNNWEKDQSSFMNFRNEVDHLKLQSKLQGKPKTYLAYEGACDPDGRECYDGSETNPYLVVDTDFGTEYDASDDEPKYFHTDQVYQEMRAWLEENVLSKL